MKKLVLAVLMSMGSVAFSANMTPQDAFGSCFHFYNCQGITYPGGFVSLGQCAAMGGLSVLEGSYCENVSGGLTADAVSPRWFGTCYLSSGCIGVSEGTWSDTQCQSMGGHSMDVGGGACINF